MSDIDVVVVLGKGVQPDGSLPELVQHTLNYAANLNKPIIVSGQHWGLLAETGALTEATVMAHYLRTRTQQTIMLEEQSKDTIGNLLLSKAMMDLHGWTTVQIVTSAEHLPRVQWLAERIFHSGYHLQYHGHEHLMTARAYVHARHYEWWAKWFDRWILRTLPTELTDPLQWLQRHHFMYSENLWSLWLRAALTRPSHR